MQGNYCFIPDFEIPSEKYIKVFGKIHKCNFYNGFKSSNGGANIPQKYLSGVMRIIIDRDLVCASTINGDKDTVSLERKLGEDVFFGLISMHIFV
jgi:hypothetical protein